MTIDNIAERELLSANACTRCMPGLYRVVPNTGILATISQNVSNISLVHVYRASREELIMTLLQILCQVSR